MVSRHTTRANSPDEVEAQEIVQYWLDVATNQHKAVAR